MPTDIALHPFGEPIRGNHPPSPVVPLLAQQKALAENTQSQTFALPQGVTGQVAIFALTATIKLRVDFRALADAGALDPGNSGIVLLADQTRFFCVPAGDWVLKTLVYA